jgi:hypothetical protein
MSARSDRPDLETAVFTGPAVADAVDPDCRGWLRRDSYASHLRSRKDSDRQHKSSDGEAVFHRLSTILQDLDAYPTVNALPALS